MQYRDSSPYAVSTPSQLRDGEDFMQFFERDAEQRRADMAESDDGASPGHGSANAGVPRLETEPHLGTPLPGEFFTTPPSSPRLREAYPETIGGEIQQKLHMPPPVAPPALSPPSLQMHSPVRRLGLGGPKRKADDDHHSGREAGDPKRPKTVTTDGLAAAITADGAAQKRPSVRGTALHLIASGHPLADAYVERRSKPLRLEDMPDAARLGMRGKVLEAIARNDPTKATMKKDYDGRFRHRDRAPDGRSRDDGHGMD